MSRDVRNNRSRQGWRERTRQRGFIWALILVFLIPILFLLWIALVGWVRSERGDDAPDPVVPPQGAVLEKASVLDRNGVFITAGAAASTILAHSISGSGNLWNSGRNRSRTGAIRSEQRHAKLGIRPGASRADPERAQPRSPMIGRRTE